MNTLQYIFSFEFVTRVLKEFLSIQSFVVMVSIALADVCWTKYFIETANKNAFKAGTWSALICICSVFAITGYIDNPWLIPSVVIGAFFGTYLTIKWENRHD